MKIKLSGLHSRRNLVVKLAEAEKLSFKNTTHLLGANGEKFPLIYDPQAAAAFLPLNQCSAEMILEIPEAATELAPPYSIQEIDEGLNISFKEQKILEFHHSKTFPKPFFGPVFTPTGETLTREIYPEGSENVDHPWQRGLFTGHGAINGYECWNEHPGEAYGRCVQTKMVEKNTPACFVLETENDWVSPAKEPMLAESRTIRLFGFDDLWVLDWQSRFQAKYGTVRIGSTKEAGFLAIRLNPQMQGDQTGLISNSYGGRTERECWSRHAQWVDYSGEINGKPAGIAILDHVDNLRHPASWHVRDYGLFAHNIWLSNPADFVLEANRTWEMNYRILIHSGDVNSADVANQYLDFENSPIIEILD